MSPGFAPAEIGSNESSAQATLTCLRIASDSTVIGLATLLTPRRLSRAALALCLGAHGLVAAAAGADTQRAAEALEAATPAKLRLISQQQYANTIAYVFGPSVTVSAHFAPFRRVDGLLANGASVAGVTSGQMQEFQRTAESLANQVVSPEYRDYLVPCRPARRTATWIPARRRSSTSWP